MRPRTPSFMQPWMLWAEFAMKSTEMWLAAGSVINTRVNRMAQAGHNPSARDRKEFLLMGTEKIQAANKSVFAMATALSRLWLPMWGGNAASFSRLAGDSARLASAGLAPIHAAATANARRLHRVPTARQRRSRG